MMGPPRREELARLRVQNAASLTAFREQLARTKGAVRAETVSSAVRAHPVAAVAITVAAAASGVWLVQRFRPSRTLLRTAVRLGLASVIRSVSTCCSQQCTPAAQQHEENEEQAAGASTAR
ncbi:MAG: hypothetical protein PWP23_1421 [Candidatus Sumerlaeota bacterium]|nr:hypothetical protein [Candidatus Sumerlaeota bacterium]